jgi:hypothetical protein
MPVPFNKMSMHLGYIPGGAATFSVAYNELGDEIGNVSAKGQALQYLSVMRKALRLPDTMALSFIRDGERWPFLDFQIMNHTTEQVTEQEFNAAAEAVRLAHMSAVAQLDQMHAKRLDQSRGGDAPGMRM